MLQFVLYLIMAMIILGLVLKILWLFLPILILAALGIYLYTKYKIGKIRKQGKDEYSFTVNIGNNKDESNNPNSDFGDIGEVIDAEFTDVEEDK